MYCRMEPILLRISKGEIYAGTYGYDQTATSETAGFCSNAPAGPSYATGFSSLRIFCIIPPTTGYLPPSG